MIYFESPSSQRFEMLDLEMIANVAKEKIFIQSLTILGQLHCYRIH